MPFEQSPGQNQSIAVIGGGISGMGAAHRLARTHRVSLFEAGRKLGGHARTIWAGKHGDQPVDTGFIVFNKANYPNLVDLFEQLNVPVVPSNMSFGASIKGGRMEYALRSLDAIFAQRRNLANPAFLRMLRDIVHFNRHGLALARSDRQMSIEGFLQRLGTGSWFRDYYLLPLCGAIWSTPLQGILQFPAHALMEFFANHALLGRRGQHQWFTVEGGSEQYVWRLEAALRARGVAVCTGAAVAGVRRCADGVEVRLAGGAWRLFDQVIFATHSDVTLGLLSDADVAERAALGRVRYQSNEVTLHADPSVMPRRRKVWSSWVYCEDASGAREKIDLTYWMNSLQPIPREDPLFVTLNSQRPIQEALIYDQTSFRHPVYDLPALRAQAQIRALNGSRGTWFCGAWMKNGFHEDGLSSGYEVADALMHRGADPRRARAHGAAFAARARVQV